MKEQSKLIRKQAARSQNREHSVPLYLTSSFIFDDAEQGRGVRIILIDKPSKLKKQEVLKWFTDVENFKIYHNKLHS